MNICVGFSRAKSPWAVGSQAIQLTEKRNFSHAYIKYQCVITGKLIIAQAAHGYVHEITEENFKERNVIVREYTVTCSDDKFKQTLSFIRDNLGVPYSYSQLFFIAIKKLLRVDLKVNNKDNAYICSEFAARISNILGIGVGSIENLDMFTPSDLNELMLKYSKEHPKHVRVSYE